MFKLVEIFASADVGLVLIATLGEQVIQIALKIGVKVFGKIRLEISDFRCPDKDAGLRNPQAIPNIARRHVVLQRRPQADATPSRV